MSGSQCHGTLLWRSQIIFAHQVALLSRHIVQRGIACILEELMKLHKCHLIYGGSYCVTPSPFENPFIYVPKIFFWEKTVTIRNIVFDIDTRWEWHKPDVAKEPFYTIERKMTVGDVEYPVVHSHPIPGYVEWEADWDRINWNIMILINLGHGVC